MAGQEENTSIVHRRSGHLGGGFSGFVFEYTHIINIFISSVLKLLHENWYSNKGVTACRIADVRKKIALCEGKRRALYSTVERDKRNNKEPTLNIM